MKTKEIPENRILDFALEAQHRIGLPRYSRLIQHYVQGLDMIRVTDEMLEKCLNEFLNACITMSYNVYRMNKTWKSYDW